MVLYMSPLAVGLFHRAIAQSPGYQDESQFHRNASAAAATMSRMCMEGLRCTSVQCMRGESVAAIQQACNLFDQPRWFLSHHGAYFSGFDGDVLPQPLWKPLCGQAAFPGSDRPILTGTQPYEWRLFHSQHFSSPEITLKFFSEHVQGFQYGGHAVQKCVAEKFLRLYEGAPATCKACRGIDGISAQLIQLAGDVEFTLGSQLLSGAPGGPRYRYLLDVEGGGGELGATHGIDGCYFDINPDKHKQCQSGMNVPQKIAAGKALREYWTTFAKTGVPSRTVGPEWKAVDRRAQGTPFLRLGFGRKEIFSAYMDERPWYSNASATILGAVACDRLAIHSIPFDDCALLEAVLPAPAPPRMLRSDVYV